MVIPSPMPVAQQAQPFDDPNWVYEIKHDGFRAMALIEGRHCWFVSRKKQKLYGFRDLATALVREVNAEMAVLDGELAVPDHSGRTLFAATRNQERREQARYYTFDLLWLNREDLRGLPLLARKQQLKRILPLRSAHVLYVDHTIGAGRTLYELVCQLDLEGIVAKRADSLYDAHLKGQSWIKIKNPDYSQKEGKADLFKRAG